MSAKVPAFTDIGKSAKEILLGGREGLFQYNQVVTISSRTADGVEFTATGVKRDEKLDTALKAAYKYKNILTAATFNTNGKVTTSVTASEVAPGLSVSLVGTVPDIQTAKLGVDYYLPHLTLKSVFGLTAQPTVNISASSGWNDLTFGGLATFDTAKDNNLTNWTAGVGYTANDFQVAAVLTDKGETVKITGAHTIDATQALAGEVSKAVHKDEATLVTFGYLKRLENGALAKAKLDNNGILHLLYEQELQKTTKLAISSQFDASNVEKAPKIGLALDIKN
jgi:voltage-dependent anion channel protein 2